MRESKSLQTKLSTKSDISVLVVDDHQGMLHSLGDILDNEGFRVSLAGSGEEAIELCQKQTFDVILMDVRMPKLDGVETIRRINKHAKNNHIIMMSAYSVEEVKNLALQEGAVAFLQKPIDVEVVIKLIQQHEQPSILLVLESEQERQMLASYLNQHKFRAHTTNFSTNVIELAQQIHFNIIITDAKMDTDDGLEKYHALKKVTPTTLFILLDETDKTFRDIGTDTALENESVNLKKPFDIVQLLSVLEKYSKQFDTLSSKNIEQQ